MDRLILLAETEHLTCLKKSKLYEMMKHGEFPRSVPVSAHRRAWLASEIQEWIQKRARQRSAEQSAFGTSPTARCGGRAAQSEWR
jgi:prophage regulatory protein